jgi:hypothetical protein
MHPDSSEGPTAETGGFRKNVNPKSAHAASKDRAASKRTRRKNMNGYQISSPRKVVAIAAVAMTAITIALSVVAPAKMQSDARDLRALTTSKAMTPAAAEVAASRLQVYVIGIREPEIREPRVREPELVSAHVRNPPPRRKQDS